MKKMPFVPSVVIGFLAACAATNLTSTWRDPSFEPNRPKKAIVIAMLNKDVARRRVEDSFVGALRKQNISAITGYSFASEKKIDLDLLRQEVDKTGADLIITTTVIDKKTTETFVPPTTTTTRSVEPGFYGYYSTRWDTTYTPGYTVTSQQAVSELKAFDAQTQKLIWTATAETTIDGGVSESTIDNFSRQAVNNLLKGRSVEKN